MSNLLDILVKTSTDDILLTKAYNLFIHSEYENALTLIKEHQSSFIYHYFCAKISECLLDYKLTEKNYNVCLSLLKTSDPYHKEVFNESKNYKINILQRWIEQNGGEISDIKIEYYDVDYRGLCASVDIKKNKPIMKIPIKCIISTHELKNQSWYKALSSFDANSEYVNSHVFLAIELLNIKYTEGHFKQPIIECLPEYFNNVPINFSDEEKMELIGSFALFKIKEKIESLTESYNRIKECIDFPYSLEDYIWARTSIITRIYGIQRKNGEKDNVMVPFADMANHKIPPNTKWFYDNDTNYFVVKSEDYISKGDNIFETYGIKSNYRYFVNYGFTIDNNPNEEICLMFDRAVYHVGYEMNSEFKTMLKDVSKLGGSILEGYRIIIEHCEERLEQFLTTLEEDNQLLKKNISFNQRNCIVQRKGEKKLLKFYIKYFKLLIDFELSKGKDKKIVKQLKKICTLNNAKGFI